MPIDSKTRLINSLKKQLETILTVSDMEKFSELLSNELVKYDVNWIETQDPISNDDYLDTFLDALRIEGRSEKTLSRYKYIITRFLNHIQIPTPQVTVFDIRRYLSYEKNRGLSDTSIEGERQIFSSYFNWLQRESLIKINPISNIGVIKSKKVIKDVYSETDIEKLRDACKTYRDKAIIYFLLSSGCRISEMVALNRNDVNTEKLECKILGKGNKERIIFLSPVAGMYLDVYLKDRKDNDPALFVSRNNARLMPGGIRKMLKKLEEDSGVANVHPHKFRRTLATNLIKRGMPIEEVAAILGHDKLDTTMEYIVLDKSEIKHSYRKYT